MYQSILYILSIQLILTLFPCFTTANVEKTIFVAPPPSPIPAENPGLDDLGLDRLSPSDFVVRTYLNASFPTEDAPQGSESWFYLEDLNPGQRYEVRICWLATVSWFSFFCPPYEHRNGEENSHRNMENGKRSRRNKKRTTLRR